MAQRKSTKGTKQLGAEVSSELVDEFKRFCAARGETVRHHLELAMRRHLANPPPAPELPPLPPFPPVTPPTAAAEPVKPVKDVKPAKGKPRKGK